MKNNILKFLAHAGLQLALISWLFVAVDYSGTAKLKSFDSKITELEQRITLDKSNITKTNNASSIFDQSLSSVARVVIGRAHGTGFFINDSGMLVTNAHVVGNKKIVGVKMNKRSKILPSQTLKAKVIKVE